VKALQEGTNLTIRVGDDHVVVVAHQGCSMQQNAELFGFAREAMDEGIFDARARNHQEEALDAASGNQVGASLVDGARLSHTDASSQTLCRIRLGMGLAQPRTRPALRCAQARPYARAEGHTLSQAALGEQETMLELDPKIIVYNPVMGRPLKRLGSVSAHPRSGLGCRSRSPAVGLGSITRGRVSVGSRLTRGRHKAPCSAIASLLQREK
jgi:hypothetical protein